MSDFEPTQAQTGVGYNPWTLIDPDAIPYPETDTWSLNYAAETIRSGGEELASISEDMETTWQGLQEHYTAPEAETLFAAVGPVATTGENLESDLATVATALEDLAEAAAEARRKLNNLKIEAQSFAPDLQDRKFWWLTKDEETDEWAVHTNWDLKLRVNSAWSDFTTAENDCANTISTVYGGASFTSPGEATGAEDELLYGDPGMFDTGYQDGSWQHRAAAWALNSATEWAGQELNPESAEFDNSRGQAAWDTLVVGFLWGSVQGAATKSGYWRADTGWASSDQHYKDNLEATWRETAQDAGTLAGIRNEDGWLIDPRSEDPYANLSWGWWWDNATDSAGQIWEGHSAWSQRESDPEYHETYTAINTVTLLGGPFRLGAEILDLGGGGTRGGSGAETGTGSENPTGSGSYAGPGPGPGAGDSGREIGDIAEEGRTPITERLDEALEQTPVLAPEGPGPGAPGGPTGPSEPGGPGAPGGPPRQDPPSQGTGTQEGPRQDPTSPGTPPPGSTEGRGDERGGSPTPGPREGDQSPRGDQDRERPGTGDQRDREGITPPPATGGGSDAPGDSRGSGTQDREGSGGREDTTRPRDEEEAPERPPGRQDEQDQSQQEHQGSRQRERQDEEPSPTPEAETGGGGGRDGGGGPPPTSGGDESGRGGSDDEGRGDGSGSEDSEQPPGPDRSEILPESSVHDYGTISKPGGSNSSESGMDPQHSPELRDLIKTHPTTRQLQLNDKKIKQITDNLEAHPMGAEISEYIINGNALDIKGSDDVMSNLKRETMVAPMAQELRIANDLKSTGIPPERIAFQGKDKITGEDLDVAVLGENGNIQRGYQAYISDPDAANPTRNIIKKLRKQLPDDGAAEHRGGVVQLHGNLRDFSTTNLATLKEFSENQGVFLHLHFDDKVVIFPSDTTPYEEGI